VSTSPRRVALITPYAVGVFGGAQEQALSMSRELESRGIATLLVTPAAQPGERFDTPARVVTAGHVIKVPVNGSRAPITLSPLASRTARVAIEAFQPDVVHVHEPFAPLVGYATVLSHSFPTVATFHRAGGGASYRLTRPLLKVIASRLDVRVAVSQSARDTALEEVGVDTEVLFNGFETERFREFARQRGDEPTVLFVGRLEERKGVRTVIEAAERAGTDRSWRLVIAGDGPLRDELVRRAAPLDRVEMLGTVSDARKRELLRSADVTVCASTSGESFGMVILEAMAAESRVVVSDIDGYQAAAGGCGVLFRAGDARSLVEAIDRAMSSADGEQITRARERAERWSMATLMDEYVARYELAAHRFGEPR
jgi:phosphatidylinositol alpha-mannosyltransferase